VCGVCVFVFVGLCMYYEVGQTDYEKT